MTEPPKPPLGIMPRRLHEKARAISLMEALCRYYEAGLMPQREWIEELTDYINRQ